MYVVTVIFRIKPEYIDAFMEAMRQQAANSLELEPDCHLFDICHDADDPRRVLLYEQYVSKDAFDTHLASDHFLKFNIQVAPWIIDKQVETWNLDGERS